MLANRGLPNEHLRPGCGRCRLFSTTGSLFYVPHQRLDLTLALKGSGFPLGPGIFIQTLSDEELIKAGKRLRSLRGRRRTDDSERVPETA